MNKVLGDRIKIVEKTGTKLKDVLTSNNPWAKEPCGRIDCLVCTRGDVKGRGGCKIRNVTYVTRCLACSGRGDDSKYYGESSRTAYERGCEHAKDYQEESEESHMFKHQVLDHPEEETKPLFEMRIARQHKSAFERQVHEAVLIEMGSS